MENQEHDFITDKTCRISVCVGAKGGGKTFLLLQYVKFSLMSNRFASYHIVLPSFTDEESGQYDWLTKHSNINIYTAYSPIVTERVKRDAAKNSKAGDKTFFALDDATHNGVDLNGDHEFLEMITTSRHRKIQIFLIFHSLRSVIVPTIRANIDYLFIFRISNNRLLNAVYEEYFSMFKEFNGKPREFASFYIDQIYEREHGCLFLDTVRHQYSPNVPDWQVMSLEMNETRKIKHASKHPTVRSPGSSRPS